MHGSRSSASRSRTPTSPGATRKHELTEYFTELATAPAREYFRPNVWPNTPDILPEYLQIGGRAGVHASRLVLAATLARELRHLRTGVRAEARTRRASPAARSTSTPRSTSCGTGTSSAPTACAIHRAGEPDPPRQPGAAARLEPRVSSRSRTTQLIAYAKTDRRPIDCGPRGREPRPAPRADRLGRTCRWTGSAWTSDAPYQMHDLLGDARYLWQGRATTCGSIRTASPRTSSSCTPRAHRA